MKDSKTSGGIGIILFLIFLILKLTKTIDWSWWWVTSPLWLPIALITSLLIIFGVFALIFKK